MAALLLCGCRPEADLDLLLVNQCSSSSPFTETGSVRVSLVGRVAFDSNLELSGCLRRDRCLSSPDQFSVLSDFSALRLTLARQDVLLTAAPGTDQAIVITGFREQGCRPSPSWGTAGAVQFCGYNVGTLPDVDSRLYLLIDCDTGEKAQICWTTEFLGVCD